MVFLAILGFVLMLVLLAVELFLWGILLAGVAVVGLILHGAGVLEPVAGAVVMLAGVAALVWAGFKAAKAFDLPMLARPSPVNLPPKDAHERHLWANRLGRYSDDP
jgi:hypothetical protein